MTVWTYELTRLAIRYRLLIAVDPSEFHPEARADLVMRHLAIRGQRQLRDAFTTYAVDDQPHLEDMRLQTREDPATLAVEVLVTWLPLVDTVELVGGPADGRVMAVPEPFRAGGWRVPQPPDATPFTVDATQPYAPLPAPLVYHLDSWNNTERRWRMTPRGTL